MFCKNGKSATIKYKFGNGAERVYRASSGFIEVQTHANPYAAIINGTTNFSEEGFEVSFISPNNFYYLISWRVHAYKVFPSPDYNFGPNYEGLSPWFCGEPDFRREFNSTDLAGTGVDITTISVNSAIKCPVESQKKPNQHSLEIKHNGIILFADQGTGPCTFEVICDDECPPGTTKCISPGHPGYCCIPCDSMAQRINNLANKL